MAADRPPISSVVTPPSVTWPDPARAMRVAMRCPNCGNDDRKTVKLTVNFATPDHPLRHSRVLSCPGCTCLFYEDQNPPDYTEESMLGRGRTAFYLQQGAGVSLITRPLAMVRRPPGATYLEVGCGFGFGLDFAIRAKRWTGTGIDPAGISGVGRELLGLPIELRYLGDDEPAFNRTCDVVMASETIEHVPSPRAFLRTLKRALRPGGILILTTPNAAEIDVGQSQGRLVPLLSPGLHLVFQNAESLRHLLSEAGFTDIRVQTDSVSLVAFASDASFELETDPGVLREAYRAYLEERAMSVVPGSDLFFAFSGRALQESVNDADWPRADRAYAVLRDACRARFGIELDTIASLPDEAATCPLERLSDVMPLNFGGILFADGMRRLALSITPRTELGPRFMCAAAAADALRRALGELAMEDGMSEDVAWAARAEGLLCEASAGRPDAVAGLAALAPAPPGGRAGEIRRGEIIERALAWMVNGGHIRLGAELAEAAGLQSAAWTNPPADEATSPPLPASRRDALFCLAIIDVQLDSSGDPGRGRARFKLLRRQLQAYGAADVPADFTLQVVNGELQALRLLEDPACEIEVIAEALVWFPDLPAAVKEGLSGRLNDLTCQRLVALVNAGNFAAASPLAAAVMSESFVADTAGVPTPAQRDVLFALGMMNIQPGGEPDRARSWFARVQASLRPAPDSPVPDLLWAALRGETVAVAMRDGPAAAERHCRQLLGALGRTEQETPADLLQSAATAEAGGAG
jgi:hypothetical protein